MARVERLVQLEEAFAINNDVPYRLSSAIYTGDVNAAVRAIEELEGITLREAGEREVRFVDPAGVERVLPFGESVALENAHAP